MATNSNVCSTEPINPSCESTIVAKTNSAIAGNIIYVDAVYGDNQTAKVFDGNKPFKSVRAAIKAAKKYTTSTIIQIFIRPGIYYEGKIKMIANISMRGSGRLATEIYGQIVTSKVVSGQEASILELMVIGNDMPAFMGNGSGRVTVRQSKLISSYITNSTNQKAIVITDGDHVVSDSEAELDSVGGVNLTVHQQQSGSYQVERTNNTVALAPLPTVMVDPTIKSFTPTKGGVNYILTSSLTPPQKFILPYVDYGNVPKVVIHTPFLVTQQSGTASVIVDQLPLLPPINHNISVGQTYHIGIQHSPIRIGSDYILKLVPPTTSITNNVNTYSSSALSTIVVPPGSSPFTPSKGGVTYVFTDSETIHLPTKPLHVPLIRNIRTATIHQTFYINQQSGGPSTIFCQAFNINVTVNTGQTARVRVGINLIPVIEGPSITRIRLIPTLTLAG